MRCRDSVPSSEPPSARCASTSSSACSAARAVAARQRFAGHAGRRVEAHRLVVRHRDCMRALEGRRCGIGPAARVLDRGDPEQPRQLGLDVLHRERGLQRRLRQRHRRLGVAVAQRDHRQVGLRIGLHHPVVGSTRQAQAFLEVLGGLRLLARAEQRNA